VKIVARQLIETLGASSDPIDLNAPAPVPIMMVGCKAPAKQTTASSPSALRARTPQGADGSLDVRVRRPWSSLPCSASRSAWKRCRSSRASSGADRAARAAGGRLGGYDVVLLDTAAVPRSTTP